MPAAFWYDGARVNFGCRLCRYIPARELHKGVFQVEERINQGICYLVGAGLFGDGEIRKRPGDYVIAVDGGYRYCVERDIEADLAVGDFDSLGSVPDLANIVRLKPEKDDTDMLHAANMGYDLGYRHFRIYGGTGGRLSHTMANIQLMNEFSCRGAGLVLVGEKSRIRVITDGSWRFGAERSGMVSVFCLGDQAAGVTLRGLKYCGEDLTLTKEFPLGCSNEFTGRAGEISVEQGSLLIVEERE